MIAPLRLAALALLLVRHPMHTSAAELRLGPGGTVQVRLRMFRDDVAAVAGSDPPAIEAYVHTRFIVEDETGRPLALVVDGLALEGDVLVLAAHGGPARLGRVRHAVMQERFGDQVNIVRIIAPQGTRTLLFLPGDPPKPVS